MSNPEQREEEIFEAARLLQGPERSSYLESECAGDLVLRERIEGLLGALERAGDLLNDPAVRREPPQPTGVAAPRTQPGDLIGGYRLLQQIGEGGCGVVYMAEQTQPVRRRVALKILKPGMDTKQVIARFEAERQALALMDHPHIARVLDAGATESGRPYFVMELVRGVKITEFCDENQLPMRQRLELFIQVCQAIQHAHQKGIIHRDIKPSNILVTVNDVVPVPKVIDFGVAKATTGQLLTDKTLFTAFEQFIGTPAYMSPEQAVMTSVDIDTRSDIYSLGVLLYELLTGKTPFDTRELLKAGFDEMRRTIREKEPARPSTRLSTLLEGELTTTAKRRHIDAPRLIQLVRGDLDWIVMKCLEKDRARRYETANGLAMDVKRYVADEPVVARPPSGAYRLRKLVKRNQAVFLAATVVVVALLVALGTSLWQNAEKSRAYRRTLASEQKSREVARFLKDMLSGVGPAVALGRDTTLLLEVVDKTADRVGRDLKDQPEVEAELRATLGDVYFELGNFAKAEVMYRRALELRTHLHGRVHLAVAESLRSLANALHEAGKLDEPEALLREALATSQKLLGSDNPEVAALLGDLGAVTLDEGKFADSEAAYRQALAMNRKHLGNEHATVALNLSSLGMVLRREDRLDEAEAAMRDGLAIQQNLPEPDQLRTAWFFHTLGTVLQEEEKLPESEIAHRQALEIRRKLLKNNHPDLGDSLNNLALLLQAQQKLGEAEAKYREALEVYQRAYGSDHPDIATALGNLGELLHMEGKLAEAETRLREAVAMFRKVLNKDHPNLIYPLRNLSLLLLDLGKLAEAETFSREALRLERLAQGSTNPLVTRSLATLVDMLLAQGKFADAEPFARECLTARESQIPDDPLTFNARCLVGACLLGMKKFADAEPLLLSGYEGLKQREARIPAAGKYRLKQTMERLVQLYEATDRPEQAAEWRKKATEFEQAAAQSAPPRVQR